jgi:hypothetical protein
VVGMGSNVDSGQGSDQNSGQNRDPNGDVEKKYTVRTSVFGLRYRYEAGDKGCEEHHEQSTG